MAQSAALLGSAQEMRFVMAQRVDSRALVSSALPVFAQANAAPFDKDDPVVVASEDGRKWCTLRSWLDPSAMKLICRRSELRITIPAKGQADVSLLPPAQEPQGELSWTTKAGAAKKAPLNVMLDVARRMATLVLTTTDEQYDEIVYALSTTQVADDCVATLTCRHTYTVRIPAQSSPGSGPTRPAGTVVRDHRLENVIVRDHRADAVKARSVMMGVDQTVSFAAPASMNLQMAAISMDASLLAKSRAVRTSVVYQPPPAEPTLAPDSCDSLLPLPLSARKEDVNVFPDLPRQPQSGWGQVPDRDQKPPLHFRDSGEPDKFFYLPSSYKLGFARDGEAARPPMRAEIYLDDAGRHRVRVTLVALPFMEEADKDALKAYLRGSILQNTVGFVGLTLAGGLESEFLPDFSSSDGTAGLPANITFSAIEVAPEKWLRMQFEMEAGSYPVFCELLRKGLRGRVVFKAPGIQQGVPVLLELDGIITDAVRATVDGETKSVSIDSLIGYPATISSARAALLDIGPSARVIFFSEELDLIRASQRLEPKGQWKGEFKPEKVLGFDEIVLSVGPVRVDGGAPQDWLDRVNRDPSLTPQPLRIKVALSVLAFAADRVELVQLRLMRDGETAPRQEHRLLPGSAPLDLSVDLTLAELSSGTSTGLYLEYETLHKDGRLSPVQRQAIRPTQRELVALALVDGADLAYTLDALTGAGSAREEIERPRLAERVRELSQQPGSRWQIYARQANPQ